MNEMKLLLKRDLVFLKSQLKRPFFRGFIEEVLHMFKLQRDLTLKLEAIVIEKRMSSQKGCE